jgi:hypothetical protein
VLDFTTNSEYQNVDMISIRSGLTDKLAHRTVA